MHIRINPPCRFVSGVTRAGVRDSMPTLASLGWGAHTHGGRTDTDTATSTRAHARTHAHPQRALLTHAHDTWCVDHQVSQCLVNPINTAEGAAAAAAEAAKAKRANVVAIGGDPSSARPGQDLLQTREAAALKENPVLLDLMKETTKDGGAFTKAEFWQGYDLEGKASSAGAASADAPIQIGISSDVLSKFKPQQQRTSQEGTTYRITKDMQDQIFQMYPKLKKVYDEKVWERLIAPPHPGSARGVPMPAMPPPWEDLHGCSRCGLWVHVRAMQMAVKVPRCGGADARVL